MCTSVAVARPIATQCNKKQIRFQSQCETEQKKHIPLRQTLSLSGLSFADREFCAFKLAFAHIENFDAGFFLLRI